MVALLSSVAAIGQNKALKFANTQGYVKEDDRIEIPESLLTDRVSDTGDYVPVTSSFTYSGWFNITDWYQLNNKVGSGLLLIGQRVHANNNPSLGLVVIRPADYSASNKRGNGGILKLVCADVQNSAPIAGNIDGATLNLDEWVYLTLMYDMDAQEIRVFKDGVRIDCRKLGVPLRLLPDYPGIISSGAFALNGAVDELQLWTRALTDDEVMSAYYDAASVGGLDLLYDFNEVAEETTGVFNNKAITEAGNGINATYYNIAPSKVSYDGMGLTNLTTYTEKAPELIEGREIKSMPKYMVTVPEVDNVTLSVRNGAEELGAGTHELSLGTNLTITATPAEGYFLVGLKYAGEYIANGSTVPVVNDAAIEVVVTNESYVLTVSDTEAEYELTAANGSVLDLDAVPGGTELNLAITSMPVGKALKEVRLGDKVLESVDGVFNFVVEGNETLTIELRDLANFAVNYISDLANGSLQVNDESGTIILPGETALEGSTIKVIVTPKSGYMVTLFTINGENVDVSSGEVEYTVMSDVAIEADFAPAVAYVAGYSKEGASYKYSTFRMSSDLLRAQTVGGEEPVSEEGTEEGGEGEGATVESAPSFTYSAWIKPVAMSTASRDPKGRLIGDVPNGYLGADGAFSVSIVDGKFELRARVYTATGTVQLTPLVTETPVTLNEWMFLSVVADNEAKTVTLYQNGKFVASLDTSKDNDGNEAYGVKLLSDASDLFAFDNGCAGYVEEVQVWSKALSVNEVRRSTRLSDVKSEGLVGLYRPMKGMVDVRNLTGCNDITGSIYSGTRDNPNGGKFIQPGKNSILLTGAAHTPATVQVTLVQPSAEDNVGEFTVTGESGRAITATAYLYEVLNVDVTKISGADVNAINVKIGDETQVYAVEDMPFVVEGDAEISIDYTVKTTTMLRYTGEHGKIKVGVNGEEPVEVTESLEIPKNAKLRIIMVPDEDYEMTAFALNGTDMTQYVSDNMIELVIGNAAVDVNVTYSILRYNVYVDAPGVSEYDVYPGICSMEGTLYDENNPFYVTVDCNTELMVCIWAVLEDDYEADGDHNVLTSITDNGVDVTGQLYDGDFEGDKYYLLGAVREDHTIVVKQAMLSGVMAISADGNGEFRLVGDKLTVTGADDAVIEVVDMNGRTVKHVKAVELSVKELVNGVYVASATTSNGVSTIKFVRF